MNTKTSRILRRTFLGGLGTTAAGALLKPIMAQAQTGVAPQRLLVIHRPCGSAMNQKAQPGAPSWWWPTSGAAGGTDWVVAPGGLIDSFNKVKQKMVIMKGVHCPRVQEWLGDKHGAGMLAMISPSPKDPKPSLAAWPVLPGRTVAEQMDTNAKFFTATDRSVDQLFLNTISTLKGTKTASIQMTPDLVSAQPPDNCLRVVSYAKDDPNAAQPTPLWPEANPTTTFKNVFGQVMTGVDQAAIDRAMKQNKSVIDFISGDLTSMKPRMPVAAAQKLESHLTAVRGLEMALNGQGTGRACMPPTIAAVPTDNDARFHQTAVEGMQLIKTAFECDLTRVISYTFGWGNSGVHFNKVLPLAGMGFSTDDTEGYHDISHNGASPAGVNVNASQFAIDKYFCTVVAGLLADMDAVKEPDGNTLLDNTLVVFWNECSVGNPHDTQDMPTLLFGGKFLKMNGGHYFDYGTLSGGKGRYMSDFWVQTSKAWATAPGVTGYTPLSSYGAPQWNTGTLDGIYG